MDSSGSTAVTHTAGWSGFSLRTAVPVVTASYTAVSFWVYGAAGGSQLQVYLQATDNGAAGPRCPFTAAAGAWQQVIVPLSSLGSPAQLARITVQEATGAAQPTYYLDDLRLVASGGDGWNFANTVADRQVDFSKSTAGVAIAPDGRLYVSSWRESKILQLGRRRDRGQSGFRRGPDLRGRHGSGSGCGQRGGVRR